MRFLRRSSHSCVASFYLCCDWLHVQTSSKRQDLYRIWKRCMRELQRNGPGRLLWIPRIRMWMPLLLSSALVCSNKWARQEPVSTIWWATRLGAGDPAEFRRVHIHRWRLFSTHSPNNKSLLALFQLKKKKKKQHHPPFCILFGDSLLLYNGFVTNGWHFKMFPLFPSTIEAKCCI